MHECKEGQGILVREQEWRKLSFHGHRKEEAFYLESKERPRAKKGTSWQVKRKKAAVQVGSIEEGAGSNDGKNS